MLCIPDLRTRASALAATLLMLCTSACGGGGGGGDGGGVDASDLVLELEVVGETAELDADPAFTTSGFAMAEQPGDGLVFAWSEYVGAGLGQRMVARTFSPSTAEFGDEVELAGERPGLLRPVSVCGLNKHQFAVAWSDAVRDLPQGFTFDIENTFVAFGDRREPVGAASRRVNDNTNGAQRRPSVLCLGDKRYVVAWVHVCSAVTRSGVSHAHHRPDECDAEPVDGVFFRVFQRPDVPVGEQVRVPLPNGLFASGVRVLGRGDGGFAVAVYAGSQEIEYATYLREYDSSGVLVSRAVAEGGDSHLMADCTLRGPCVVIGTGGGDATATVVWPDGEAQDYSLLIEEAVTQDPPPGYTDASLVPQDATVACNRTGVCMLAWQRVRVLLDYDVVDWEFLGVFGRALDPVGGRLGETVQLRPASLPERFGGGPLLAAVGVDRFFVADPARSPVSIREVLVR